MLAMFRSRVLLLRRLSWCLFNLLSGCAVALLNAQTSATGALSGVVFDGSGSVVSGAMIRLSVENGSEVGALLSSDDGSFRFASIPPSSYVLQASKTRFKTLTVQPLHIHVTETLRIELHLQLAIVAERAEVTGSESMIQLDTAALGKVTNENIVHQLPLATRNFSQLAGLSTGVVTGVYNAGELGIGGTALAQISPSNDGLYVHGTRSYDNNWQLDGISVSDVLATGSASGGIPIPNPDALMEFKVQTGIYGAGFGRAAGANVAVITKAGTNQYHATLFEFLRNDVLNANDFFLNQANQRRPALKQNQFGFAFGGPIQKDKLLFFGSYQGTRQVNGIAGGQARVACSATLREPPLTNDRSPAALGSLFQNMSGAFGGVAVNRDGSNINQVALALLNFKLPNGRFLIPTPQTIDSSKPFASQGFSAFSEPCHFDENQLLANLDYKPSQKNQFAVRSLVSHDKQLVTFPGNGRIALENIAGFSSPGTSDFALFSLSYTYILSNARLNEARIGFVHTKSSTGANAPFAWSDIGASEGTMNKNNQLPSLQILGSASMGAAFPRTYAQNSFVLDDVFTTISRSHTLQLGGSLTRLKDPLHFDGFDSFIQFLSWPDFLLGLNATDNGSKFSNVYQSADGFGLLDRDFRAWEVSAFAQDNYRITNSLTLDLGVRYEHPGQFADNLGRAASFDFNKANRNPAPGGSLDGYLVASNFQGAPLFGVTRVDNAFGTYGNGQNTIAPRAGFAWRLLPQTTRLVLRGGYGIYYSRPTGQSFTASILAAPFALTRTSTGPANAAATLQAPFAQPFPTPSSFPMFPPYSQTSKASINVLAPNFRPAMVQQFSLNTQAALQKNLLLEVAYVGTRGTHLQRFRSLNQALNASPRNPVRGATSSTLANIPLRVPIPGILPDSFREMESEGSSWYNGLEASLRTKLSHGVQFLASYTFSKILDTDGSNINGTSAANTLPLGDQNAPAHRWGRASFDRTHRFVFSETWDIPGPSDGVKGHFLHGWSLATLLTIQSGTALTIADTNASNVYGISEDRAELTGSCATNQLVREGPISLKLTNYFNASCFTTPRVIGADGIGTDFGNSATGVVNGPGQANLDIAFSKAMFLSWPREKSSLQFRAEFFNALNHPQFTNPDSNFTSPTFGVISSTAVNARVGQIALRFYF
jgi:carboxypeptidase family protein/TonB-dependent receptor-like protein